MSQVVVAHAAPVYPRADFGFSAAQLVLMRGWMKYGMHLPEEERAWPEGGTEEYIPISRSAHSYLYKPVMLRAQPIQRARNMIADYALEDQGEEDAGIFSSKPADILVWQDSDVQPDGLLVLQLAHTLLNQPPAVGAVGIPLPKQYAEDRLSLNVVLPEGVPSHPANRPFFVRRIGFGLIAIRAQVFHSLSWPWFEWKEGASRKEDPLGEDYGFCDRMTAAGYQIVAWPRPDVTHNFIRRFGLASLVDQELATLAATLGDLHGTNPIAYLRRLIDEANAAQVTHYEKEPPK